MTTGADARDLTALRTRTLIQGLNLAFDQVVPEDSTRRHYLALTRAGARPEDLDLFHAHSRFPSLDLSCKALFQSVADMRQASIGDAVPMRWADAIAWAIVGHGTSDDLTGPPRWYRYTRHGWLFHAAGIEPADALTMDPVPETDLRFLIGLRGTPAPALLAGEPLEWPTATRPDRSVGPAS